MKQMAYHNMFQQGAGVFQQCVQCLQREELTCQHTTHSIVCHRDWKTGPSLDSWLLCHSTSNTKNMEVKQQRLFVRHEL